jgi:hypothetical protein
LTSEFQRLIFKLIGGPTAARDQLLLPVVDAVPRKHSIPITR